MGHSSSIQIHWAAHLEPVPKPLVYVCPLDTQEQEFAKLDPAFLYSKSWCLAGLLGAIREAVRPVVTARLWRGRREQPHPHLTRHSRATSSVCAAVLPGPVLTELLALH